MVHGMTKLSCVQTRDTKSASRFVNVIRIYSLFQEARDEVRIAEPKLNSTVTSQTKRLTVAYGQKPKYIMFFYLLVHRVAR